MSKSEKSKHTPDNPTLKIEIYDQDAEKHHPFEVMFDENGIYIIPKGFGDYHSRDGHGIPIMIEMFGGEPRVILWDDINEQDSSHVIGLKNASEKLRKNEDGTVIMSANELDKLRREKIEDIWLNYDLGLEEMGWEFADTDGWEHVMGVGEYWRTFYYYKNPDSDEPSTKATFTVQFKPGSTEVLDAELCWE